MATWLPTVWTIEDLGPVVGLLDTNASGQARIEAVNDAGVAVGAAPVVNSAGVAEEHAVIFDKAAIVDIHPTNARQTFAQDINHDGWIVGDIDLAVSRHGFVRSPVGAMSVLKTPAGTVRSGANSISNSGQIVGAYRLTFGTYDWKGLSWGPPAPTSTTNPAVIHSPNVAVSSAHLVNDAGRIAGRVWAEPTMGGGGAGIYEGGLWMPLQVIGPGEWAEVEDMNASGTVVGWSDLLPTGLYPFIYEAGVLTKIPSLWPTIGVEYPRGISDSGEVVGQGSSSTSPGGAFFFSKANGLRRLDALLPKNSGWILDSAEAISPSGWIIVGFGRFAGQMRFFRMTRGVKYLSEPESRYVPETWVGRGSGLDDGGIGIGPHGPIPIPPWVARLSQSTTLGMNEVIQALLVHESANALTDSDLRRSIQPQLLKRASDLLARMSELAAQSGAIRKIKKIRHPSRLAMRKEISDSARSRKRTKR